MIVDNVSKNVVGVILAGGLASRMGGGDKSLKSLGKKTILENVMDRLSPQVATIVLNANGDPQRFSKFKIPIIHDQTDQAESLNVEQGLSLTSSLDVLENIGKGSFKGPYRLALGYCGWDGGQLDTEVNKNSWLIVDIPSNIVFQEDPNDLVKRISKEVGFDIDKIQNSEIITKH